MAFTRDPARAHVAPGVETAKLDVSDSSPDARALEQLDAIVHLAGETVAGRWSQEKKRRIYDSRVNGTRNLVAALAALEKRPPVFICASAIGYYGDRGNEVLDDASPPGRGFLADVCARWEHEAQAAAKLGIRVVSVRIATVFGAGGGALAELIPICNAGAGGPLGSGRQWMPWIHVDDLAALFCFAIDRNDMSGAIVGASPDYATNARIMAAVCHALRRPALLPAPAFALKAVLGEFAGTLLAGQLVLPQRAAAAGFRWRHTQLEEALIDIVAPASKRRPALRRLSGEMSLASSPDKVIAFFSDASSLEKVSPPAMRVRLTPRSARSLSRGAVVEYILQSGILRLRCQALIAEWRNGADFTDVQVRGPFLWWRHVHEFEVKGDLVVVRDRLEYLLPFQPLGNIALSKVQRDIENAFAFRRRAIEEIFAA